MQKKDVLNTTLPFYKNLIGRRQEATRQMTGCTIPGPLCIPYHLAGSKFNVTG